MLASSSAIQSRLVARHALSAIAGSRLLATAAATADVAHAVDPAAKPPAKRFPPKAEPLRFAVGTVGGGVRVASVDDRHAPVSSLALVVGAGPRFHHGAAEQGVAQFLKHYAFKTTNNRSSIRITREADIMGHQLTSAMDRENIYLSVDFRRDDLHDAVDLLADVLDGFVRRDSQPWGIYSREFVRKTHDWAHTVEQVVAATKTAHVDAPKTRLMDNLFRVAFRGGLGNALYPTVGALDVEHVHAFAAKHLVAPKTALVGFGVDHADLMQAASYFLGGFTAASTPATVASKYHGGEHMDEAAAVEGVHYALAGPTTGYTGDDHFTAAVLRELFGASNVSSVAFGTNHRLLGGINAAPGVTVEAFSESYSDAGLFGFYVQGSNDVSSASVSAAIKSTVAQLKEVAAGNFGAAGTDLAVKRAVQAAKLTMLDDSVDRLTKLREVHARVASGNKALASSASVAAAFDGVTAQKLSKLASNLLAAKPSISALGDAYGLPYSDQMGH